MRLADDVWAVVLDTLKRFDGIQCDSSELRAYVEAHTQITPFDGGAFIANGNEFDVFVVPQKRGKWAIRKEINAFLAKLAQKYDKAIVKIHTKNTTSLRLAVGFGFLPVGKNHKDKIILERPLWVT